MGMRAMVILSAARQELLPEGFSPISKGAIVLIVASYVRG